MNNDNHLEYFGVKGMKWGVRTEKIGEKIKKATKEKKEWEKVSKKASIKRFLGNPSEKDIADSYVKSLNKKIGKLSVKEAKLKLKQGKVSNIYDKITGSDKLYADLMYEMNKK